MDGARRRFQEAWSLLEKFSESNAASIRRGRAQTLCQTGSVALICQGQRSVQQPVGRLDEGRACGYVRLLPVAHFQIDRAKQFPLDRGRADIRADAEIELKFQSGTCLAEIQVRGRQLRKMRLRMPRVDHDRRFPLVLLVEQMQGDCLGALREIANRPAQAGIGPVDDELARCANAARDDLGFDRAGESDQPGGDGGNRYGDAEHLKTAQDRIYEIEE